MKTKVACTHYNMRKRYLQLEKATQIRKKLAQFIDEKSFAFPKYDTLARLLCGKYKLSEQQASDLFAIYSAISSVRSLKLSERRNLFFVRKKRTDHLLHLVESEQLTKIEIEKYINYGLRLKCYLTKSNDNYAKRMKLKKLLADKIIFNLFIERSSRTHRSFDAAAKMLGASVINEKDPTAISLMSRNESFADSIRTFCQYSDLLILRAPWPYVIEEAIEAQKKLQNIIPVINAGSGSNQHPTQGLLDVMTIKEVLKIKSFDELKKKRVVIIGTRFKRALRSFIITLYAVCPEIEFVIIAPPGESSLKNITKRLNFDSLDITISNSISKSVRGALVIYLASIESKPTSNYQKTLKLKEKNLKFADKRCIILHPLPRNSEMNYNIGRMPSNQIWTQVKNGLYIRAILLIDCFGRLKKIEKILRKI